MKTYKFTGDQRVNASMLYQMNNGEGEKAYLIEYVKHIHKKKQKGRIIRL